MITTECDEVSLPGLVKSFQSPGTTPDYASELPHSSQNRASVGHPAIGQPRTHTLASRERPAAATLNWPGRIRNTKLGIRVPISVCSIPDLLDGFQGFLGYRLSCRVDE
jgi:hypothetical protein